MKSLATALHRDPFVDPAEADALARTGQDVFACKEAASRLLDCIKAMAENAPDADRRAIMAKAEAALDALAKATWETVEADILSGGERY